MLKCRSLIDCFLEITLNTEKTTPPEFFGRSFYIKGAIIGNFEDGYETVADMQDILYFGPCIILCADFKWVTCE